MPRTETMDPPPTGVASSLPRKRETVNLTRSRAPGLAAPQPASRRVPKCCTAPVWRTRRLSTRNSVLPAQLGGGRPARPVPLRHQQAQGRLGPAHLRRRSPAQSRFPAISPRSWTRSSSGTTGWPVMRRWPRYGRSTGWSTSSREPPIPRRTRPKSSLLVDLAPGSEGGEDLGAWAPRRCHALGHLVRSCSARCRQGWACDRHQLARAASGRLELHPQGSP